MKKTNNKATKRTGHVVSHTHWDREWRYPIWETRLMLVDFMDELIGLLEKGTYPGFLLDGQVTPVLDYLEIRPEMTDRVKALVAADKLQIGPWLILPDEFPIDGESLVRNLLLGTRQACELGGVFNVGYTSFGWGQTAQLPQIYAGFGIDLGMVGKRVDKKRAPHSEFIWQAPDGSQMLTTRFGDLGRQNFYFCIHLSALFGMEHLGDTWYYDWAGGGLAFHRADREQMEQDHFRLDAPQKWFPDIITPELIDKTWETTDESVLADDRLMMNGCDYTAAQPMFPEMMKKLNDTDSAADRQWIHTTMSRFVEVMRQKLDRSQLPVVTGELRDGPAAAITGNALTTRLYLKQLNKKAQNLLIRFAEPLSVLAALAGAAFPETFLNKAWRFLLDSHPHDSINGVTQDKTVLDVENRLQQVIDLSQSLGNRAMQELIRRINLDGFDKKDVLVVVFNPLPYPRREILEAWVNMPIPAGQTEAFWTMDVQGLQMFDAQGRPVSTQWQGCSHETYCVAEVHTRAFPFPCKRHRVFFDTGEIPAGGYKVFKAAPIQKDTYYPVQWTNSNAATGTLLKTPTMLENEYLQISMNPNGTFDLTDKESGQTYTNLNYYEDRGEHGDYWINRKPMFDQALTSLGCSARIWSEEAGPLQGTLVSEITMQIPSKGIRAEQRRGDHLTDLVIRTALTLQAGSRQVDVKVDFENHQEDHFLRAIFPTNLKDAAHADAGGHFTVDHRPIRPQGPNADSVWPDMATLPLNNFIDVSDGQNGLAFLTDCLTEYEVMDHAHRAVALSLLRATHDWICTEMRAGSYFPSQKGGQCLRPYSLRYALRPHTGNWQTAEIPLAAEFFNVPAIPVQTRASRGDLPARQASLFEIDNHHLRFSTLKKAQDRDTWIIRLYNPTPSQQKGHITFHNPLTTAWQTNLNEQRQKEIKRKQSNRLPVQLNPHEIATVEFCSGENYPMDHS